MIAGARAGGLALDWNGDEFVVHEVNFLTWGRPYCRERHEPAADLAADSGLRLRLYRRPDVFFTARPPLSRRQRDTCSSAPELGQERFHQHARRGNASWALRRGNIRQAV